MKDFDERYFDYSSDYSKAILKGRKPLHNRFLVSYIRKLRSGRKLLEVGCGKGFFLEYAQKYFDAYGVDISKYAISSTRGKCKNSGLQVGSANSLAFADHQFDVIVCFDVLEHIDHPRVVIKEFSRILRKSGLLVASVPNTGSLGRLLKRENWFGYRDTTHLSVFTKNTWIRIFREAGFEIVDLLYDGLWDSPYFSILPVTLQHLLFKFPATILFASGLPIPERLGESVFIVSMRRGP